jgi:hypothetical protein
MTTVQASFVCYRVKDGEQALYIACVNSLIAEQRINQTLIR